MYLSIYPIDSSFPSLVSISANFIASFGNHHKKQRYDKSLNIIRIKTSDHCQL